MKFLIISLAVALSALTHAQGITVVPTGSNSLGSLLRPSFTPPATKPLAVTETVHGIRLSDSYRWLEDYKNEEVVTWTRSQHDAALSWLDTNAPPVPGLRDELTRFIDRTITSPPSFYKGREFFTRKIKGDAQAKLYTRVDGKEVLLFDPMTIDASGKSALSGRAHSRDASIVAVGLQRAGDELPTQYFIDSKTGRTVYPPLKEVWSVSWTKDNAVAYLQPRTQEQVSKQLPLYSQKLTFGTELKDAPIVHRFTDSKQWGGVRDYEHAPYTVYSTGEGKSAKYALQKTGNAEERCGCCDQHDRRHHLRLVQRGRTQWPFVQSERQCAGIQGLEANRCRAKRRGAREFCCHKN
jgi:prolyl oligopeptidase